METVDLMDAGSSAAPAASASPAQVPDATGAEEQEEMPLLLMDQLPSNFQQNAQLAAIATFMADSDDDAAADDDDGANEAANGSKERRQRQQKATRSSRRQQPYAKPLPKDKETKHKKNGEEKKTNDTKELQLFLSMFHVS
ncbi:unnamed protein product [Phytophthora lilii]|uniref:Unnamed protein product n=1 Tax=Phytophthora lilii TaxID=2077276 RepID=A0A9W6TEB5_9STRA|nr:unnamed protein product [Phytophthora lilii]